MDFELQQVIISDFSNNQFNVQSILINSVNIRTEFLIPV